MQEGRFKLEADHRRGGWLLDLWQEGKTVPVLVWLSRLYRSVSSARRDFYLRRRSHPGQNTVVIGVGNLTVGGSGKTPLVLKLCQRGRELGLDVAAVVGATGGGLDPAGDEFHMLDRSLDEVRVELASNKDKVTRRLAGDFDLVVIDDALQVFSLEKDLEVVAMGSDTATDENPRLLPAGPYRELPSALERADVVVVTDPVDEQDQCAWLRSWNGTKTSISYRAMEGLTFRRAFQHLVIGNYHQLRSNLGPFIPSDRPREVVAFAGIGNPFGFFEHLGDLMEENLIRGFAFPDHFSYRRINFVEISDVGSGKLVYTTEKDFFRIVADNGGLEDDPPAEWYDLLERVGHWQFIPVDIELPEELEIPRGE